mmetsp:Transcript_29170/g.36199  ORF Transcript_29170/g.36199 Transcript_29170/m.36199 type:complete len:219 (-) Transcript_29170:569-1225(-)
MAIRQNRYRSMYEAMVRPMNASTFPRHVFTRGQNIHSNIYDRVGNRDDCFDTTLVHLTERFNGKDVYLVGTSNQSTMLAQRTQKLIEELRPDTVLVQTSPEWWNRASIMKYVDSQEEMNKYAAQLDSADQKTFDYYHSNRKMLALLRLSIYNFLFRNHFGFTAESWVRPGLEMKFACESAQKVGADLKFLGSELDADSQQRLMHETRFNAIEYFVRRF